MTDQQTEALRAVKAILSENFDSWVLTTKSTNEALKSQVSHFWEGDIVDVLGLCGIAHNRIAAVACRIGGNSNE